MAVCLGHSPRVKVSSLHFIQSWQFILCLLYQKYGFIVFLPTNIMVDESARIGQEEDEEDGPQSDRQSLLQDRIGYLKTDHVRDDIE